ncbi:MAG: TetR/AcrR family transcriptional regulator [Alphaproteobacteria bacterium]|nr:TetR/AcrR family transcriptional regulator [Alphaproteobacteria bacterium]
MPKLKPETLEARRGHILDAAERCFAQSGFHRCTMADICAEAGISPGALYVHFESKEALIAGIVERNRAELTTQFGELANAPDFTAALGALGEHYAVDEPQYKRILNLEIAAEATRNEKIAELFLACDRFVIESFTDLIDRATREGRIAPVAEPKVIAQTLCIIGEGMFWRRAVDPDFNGRDLMATVLKAVGALINPQQAGAAADATATSPARLLEEQS